MGRNTRGVIGIRLGDKDLLVGMEILREGAMILTVTENGYGKRTSIEEYRLQRRSGKGLINIRVTERNGTVIGILQSFGDDEFMMITDTGKIIRIRVDLESLRTIGRSTQGVKLQDLGSEGHRIMAIAPVLERESSDNGDDGDDDFNGTDDNGGFDQEVNADQYEDDYPEENGLYDGGEGESGDPEILEIEDDE